MCRLLPYGGALRCLPLLWILACATPPLQSQSNPEADGAVSPADQGVVTDSAPDAVADAGVADAAPDALTCMTDVECGDGLCMAGNCVERAPDMPLTWPQDGVVRVAAARFDATPEEFETWRDAAGPECPDNRPGRFDGRVDAPPSDAPCADTYEDANGNGRFDAIWLAGAGADRPAMALDDGNPPEGRVLLMTRGEIARLWVVLDVHAIDAAQVHRFQTEIAARLGLSPGQILVQATGSRSGPDVVGLSGPSIARFETGLSMRLGEGLGLLGSLPARSGLDKRWWDAVTARCAAAARRAAARLGSAQVRIGQATLPVDGAPIEALPDLDADGLRNDADDLLAWRSAAQLLARSHRLPGRIDPQLKVIRIEGADDLNPIILVSWAVAPATSDAPILSADFPGHLRRFIEERHPGAVAIWTPGVADDSVRAGAGAFIPAVDGEGRPIDAAAEPVDVLADAAPADAPAHALGAFLGARALAAVADADATPLDLQVRSRYAWLPLTNPRFGIAARLRLMPGLGDWMTGRAVTDAWASGAQTPACGGLGCLRYRLDHIALGPVELLTTPGALDVGYALGREALAVPFDDQRNLLDLDGDAIADAVDALIEVLTRNDSHETAVTPSGPANPQRFDAIEGLGGERIWLLGRVNGGVGSAMPAESHQNVFEGQLEVLQRAVQAPPIASINLCRNAFDCRGEITLGELVDLTWASQPNVLADLPGAHELWLLTDPPREPIVDWHIEDADGTVVLFGGPLDLGPGRRAFVAEHDLVRAGVGRGHRLALGPPGAVAHRLEIGGVVPVELRTHPNAGDEWWSSSPAAGDQIYRVACELLYDGECPTARGAQGDDPMQGLPRVPGD